MQDISVEVKRLVDGTIETTFLDMKGVLSIDFVLPVSPRRVVCISESHRGPHSLDIHTIDADIKVLPHADNSIVIEAVRHGKAT